jgi:hypothetical protein
LRIENPEVWNHEGDRIVDLGGADLVCGFEKGRSEPSVPTVPSRSGDRWSRSIAGIGGARTLKS